MMSRLSLFSLILVLSLWIAIVTPCRQDWDEFGGSCYGFGETYLSWAEADDFCKSVGAKLAEIETKDENDFIKALLRQKSGDVYWVGATDVFHEGDWVWMSTGAPLSPYNDWSPGEPNDDDGYEDCLHLLDEYDFKWNDADCSLRAEFICEAEADDGVVG